MFRVLFISVWFILHPVHVTLTSIDFVPDPGYFSVFVRMYYDDFLTDSALNVNEINDADINTGTSRSRDAMEKYLREKLIIKANEKHLEGKIREMSLVDNEISMNIEYKWVEDPDSVLVRNLILTDIYPDQSNMVIVRVNNFEEGAKLTSDLTEKIFIIK